MNLIYAHFVEKATEFGDDTEMLYSCTSVGYHRWFYQVMCLNFASFTPTVTLFLTKAPN